MKITDLIVEQKLDEKPMGALAGLGNKIASKFGSGKAMGKLDTGKIANDLRKQFDVYLGKTGQQADAQVIVDFLSSIGLPTDAVNASSAAATTTTAPAQDMKTTLGVGKNAGKPMATPNPKEPTGPINTATKPGPDTQPAAGPEVDYDTPAYRRKGVPEPTFDKPASNQPATAAQAQPADKLKSPYSNVSYNTSTGFDKDTMQNKSKPMSPGVVGGVPNTSNDASRVTSVLRKANNPTNSPQQALKARLNRGGGKVKTGFGAYKAAAAAKGLKAGMYDSVSYESLKQEMFLTEALSGSQIDKIFLATAQLMAKQGMSGASSTTPQGGGQTAQGGGTDSTAPQGGSQGLFKSFAQGFKDTDGQKGQASAFNKTQSRDQDFAGSLNFNQLSKLLPSTDPATLIRTLKMVISGGKLNQQQLGVLGVAMTDIVKADAQTTSKIMQTLKRISAE
jgi:hypothetical protein